MNVCQFCGNKHLKELAVQYTLKHDDRFFIVNDVPCIQCEYCGEQYFQVDVLKQIETEFQAIYQQGKKATMEVLVPVEHFSELKKIAS